jgi:hypothetical protein
MPRRPIGERAMTGAERLRRWRERKWRERLAQAAGDDEQRVRLRKATLAAKQRYYALSKAVSGQTPDETRERLAAGARTIDAMTRAWVEDHPGHTAVDFNHWGSCAATPEQERHWHDWADRFDRKAAVQAEPSSSEELAEAKREIAALKQELAAVVARLAGGRRNDAESGPWSGVPRRAV